MTRTMLYRLSPSELVEGISWIQYSYEVCETADEIYRLVSRLQKAEKELIDLLKKCSDEMYGNNLEKRFNLEWNVAPMINLLDWGIKSQKRLKSSKYLIALMNDYRNRKNQLYEDECKDECDNEPE